MKEHHHVDICKQEDQVCTGFFNGLEASATDHAGRPQWDRISAFSRPGGPPKGLLIVAHFLIHQSILQARY